MSINIRIEENQISTLSSACNHLFNSFNEKIILEKQKSHYFMQKRQISTNLRTEDIKDSEITKILQTVNLFNSSFEKVTKAEL